MGLNSSLSSPISEQEGGGQVGIDWLPDPPLPTMALRVS